MKTGGRSISVVITSLVCIGFSALLFANQRASEVVVHDDGSIDTASLARLYERPTDFLWIDNSRLSEHAYAALDFIASSADHGLNPDDYHLDLLRELEPEFDASEASLFDLVLSDGMLKLLRDMSIGRLDPGVVDPKWTIPRVRFDAIEFLQQALSRNHFAESLNSLIPVYEQYRQLSAAAVRYLGYVDRGDWAEIPESPVLHVGDSHQNIPAIRERLAFEDTTMLYPRPSKLDYYDEELAEAVMRFQRQHSLPDDGIVGPATLSAMNVSAVERLQQIKINLERLRWLPDDLGKRYIMVNTANYQLTAIEDEQVKLEMRVIVGKEERSTPSFSSQMTSIVINPHWYVPSKLAREDLLPKQQSNPDYFMRNHFRVYDKRDGAKNEISPDSVDWQSMSKQYFPFSLVQDPGKKNALGQLKFILPNPWSIYLHDTPSKSLFNRNQRAFSSGCIRVEDPLALAQFSLSGNHNQQSLLDGISANESYSAELEQPVSVYAVYATVWSRGNELIFSPDSYSRDQKMAQFL